MKNSPCVPFELELQRLAQGGSFAVSDALALHLDACATCRRQFDRGAVPLDAMSFERLDAEASERLLRPRERRRFAGSRGLRSALAATVVASLGLATLWALWFRPATTPALATALVEDHIRYLSADDRLSDRPLTELVRDLEGYVDFPVALPRAGAARLTGVRRCFLLGRRVVLAFYQQDSVPLSYFVLPANGLDLPRDRCGRARFHCASELGFSLVSWRRSGLLHSVVAADPAAALKLAESAFEPPTTD